MNIYLMLLFVSISLSITGQLLLKKGMLNVGFISLRKDPFGSILKTFSNKIVLMGVFVFGLSAFVWLVVLSNLDLSFAYPIVSLGYVLIAFASRIFFKEKITFYRWLSIFIICIGVSLVGYSI